jgi:sorbitol-specific phosphotransferase system component IIBC
MTGVAVAVPFAVPQLALVELVLIESAAGCVKVDVALAEHEAASVTVNVNVPGERF